MDGGAAGRSVHAARILEVRTMEPGDVLSSEDEPKPLADRTAREERTGWTEAISDRNDS